jgi:hypothetical protein
MVLKNLLPNFNANNGSIYLTAYLIYKLFFTILFLVPWFYVENKDPTCHVPLKKSNNIRKKKTITVTLRILHVLFIGLAKFDMATIQTFFALQMLVLAKILDLSQTKHYFIELVSSDFAQPCHACQCSVNQGRGRRVPPPPRLFLGAVQRPSSRAMQWVRWPTAWEGRVVHAHACRCRGFRCILPCFYSISMPGCSLQEAESPSRHASHSAMLPAPAGSSAIGSESW